VSQYVRIARGVAGNVSAAGQIADFTADFRLLLGALGAPRHSPSANVGSVASVSSDMRSLFCGELSVSNTTMRVVVDRTGHGAGKRKPRARWDSSRCSLTLC